MATNTWKEDLGPNYEIGCAGPDTKVVRMTFGDYGTFEVLVRPGESVKVTGSKRQADHIYWETYVPPSMQ